MDGCSVVIATRNRSRRLHETLLRLEALPEAPRIIVVDNGSTDETLEVVRDRHPAVRTIALGENRGAAARNVGVQAAGTPYVAFCDDDAWWEAGSLARATALLGAYPQVGLVNARVVVHGLRTDEACRRMAASPLPKRSACPGTAIAQFMAGAAVARREAFMRAGGYDARYLFGAEESLLALDLLESGWELIYDEEIVVHHAPAPAGRVPVRRRTLVLRNRLWTAWLRRPLPVAVASTLALGTAARRDPAARAALVAAVRGLPWILRERRPVGRRVEALMAALTDGA